MKITRIETFRYSIPLVETLAIGDRNLVIRSGLLLRIAGDNGAVGVGEAAPLPGYSADTLDEALKQAETLSDLAGQDVPEGVERLDGGFDAWLGARGFAPSLRCGIETAVLNLIAATRGTTLRAVVSPDAHERVRVMGLLNGNLGEIRKKAQHLHNQGYTAVKLKVGRYSLADDVQTTAWLCRNFGDAVSLRLDANRAWDFDTAMSYARQTEDCQIAYIEEPLREPGRVTEFAEESGINVALDETLRDMPPDRLQAWPNVTTLILKPTVLGLEHAVRLARRARELGLSASISSTFESGFGLAVLAQVAAAIQPEKAPAGLDTYEWLDADVIPDRLPIRQPVLEMAELDGVMSAVSFDKLQKVSNG